MSYVKIGEDSLGKGIYIGPCRDCKNRGKAASFLAGFDCCWGYHTKNRVPGGLMKCFQPKEEPINDGSKAT